MLSSDYLSEAALLDGALVPLAALGVMASLPSPSSDDKRSGVSASMSSSMLPANEKSGSIQVKSQALFLLHTLQIISVEDSLGLNRQS